MGPWHQKFGLTAHGERWEALVGTQRVSLCVPARKEPELCTHCTPRVWGVRPIEQGGPEARLLGRIPRKQEAQMS